MSTARDPNQLAVLDGWHGMSILFVLAARLPPLGPKAGIAATVHRVSAGTLVDIVTWQRVDEILAGSILALTYANKRGSTTLFAAPPRLGTLLRNATLRYIAAVSFALYAIHHLLMYSWLGSGNKWVKDLK